MNNDPDAKTDSTIPDKRDVQEGLPMESDEMTKALIKAREEFNAARTRLAKAKKHGTDAPPQGS